MNRAIVLLLALAISPAISLSMAVAADETGSDLYLLDTCVVLDSKLGSMGEPVIHDHEGREVRFCCAGCLPAFEENPAKYLKAADEKMIEQQLPHYPLETCLVTGEPLGSMGEPVNVIHKNRLVRFCCNECPPTFAADPATHLAKLDEAVREKQGPTYPLETCVVAGTQLGSMGEAFEFVSGNRLVRMCCRGCLSSFKKEPGKYLDAIDEASKEQATGEEDKVTTQEDDPEDR